MLRSRRSRCTPSDPKALLEPTRAQDVWPRVRPALLASADLPCFTDMLMNNGARCRVSREFGVLWCDPPRGCIGPPWWTIVFLHGRGEGGDGSPEELPRIVGGAGLPFEIARRDNQLLQDPELFPFLVVAPQTAVRWEQEHARVDRVIRDLRESGFVRGRPLLTGFSIGGDGAWAIATKDPSAFAGITPIAGEDPQPTQHIASALAQLPIWIGYRNDDYSSRRRPSVVIDALAKAGNTNVEVRDYYPGSTPDGLSPHTCAAHQAYTDSRFHAWLRDRCH